MSQSAASSFLDPGRVFNRGEYAVAVGLKPDDPALDAMLARHIRDREIRHVVEDVYGALPRRCKHPDSFPMDPYLVASRLRPGAVLAYHSALDLHGFAYSITHCIVHAFSPAGREEIDIDGRFYDFRDPAPGILLGGERPGDGIEIATLWDVDVRVTTLERTLADLFVCPDTGGDGLIESIEAIDMIHDLDAAALVRHILALDDAAATGAVGFWLESRRGRSNADDAAIGKLRALAPPSPRYALGTEKGCRGSLFVKEWNVFLPERFVVPEINGVPFQAL